MSEASLSVLPPPPIPQMPMLFAPKRSAEKMDFREINEAIVRLGDDPKKYAASIESFRTLRRDALNADRTMAGRDSLYKYFGQIELFELHFTVDANNANLSFIWYPS
jgi:hypothetical protein